MPSHSTAARQWATASRRRLLPPHAFFVRRHISDNFVAFRMQDPAPGRWHLEVRTLDPTHVRYTAGVFVDSPLRLLVSSHPRWVRAGDLVRSGVTLLDQSTPFTSVRPTVTVSAPALGLAGEIEQWRRRLDEITPPKLRGGDTLPDDVARLAVLEKELAGKDDLFARRVTAARLLRERFPWDEALLSWPGLRFDRDAPALVAEFRATEPGSYNVTVSVSGTAPRSGWRFVRKKRVCFVVH